MPGMGELLIILVIVLLIFGAGKLPAIGDALGRSIKNFRRSAQANDEIEVSKKKALPKDKKAKELDEGSSSSDDEAEDDEAEDGGVEDGGAGDGGAGDGGTEDGEAGDGGAEDGEAGDGGAEDGGAGNGAPKGPEGENS